MALLQTLLAFAVVLGVLVVVHELGHYLVARWCGVKVLRFSVGLGKVIWSRRFGPDQTEWAVSAIPLGGYVKMLDAREETLGELSAADAAREFTRQPVAKRIAIVAAGPVANFLLAIAIFAGLYMHGIPEPVPRISVIKSAMAEQAGLQNGDLVTAVNGEPVKVWSDLRWKLLQAAMEKRAVRLDAVRPSANDTQQNLVFTLPLGSIEAAELDAALMEKVGLDLARPRAILGKILPGGPAERAGLQSGDLIEAINGEPVTDGVAFIERLQNSAGLTLLLSGSRSGQPFSSSLVPQPDRSGDRTVGRIMAQVDMRVDMTTLSAGPFDAVTKAVTKTWDTCSMTLKMLGKMITGEASLKNITGPITIADYAGQTVRIGAISFLSFIAFISISLGVMNLLPIPVLDGGHLLYYSLELLTGRPVPERIGAIAQRAGLGLLMVLMVVAVFNDIARLML
jgi:regulator of sigma E protease